MSGRQTIPRERIERVAEMMEQDIGPAAIARELGITRNQVERARRRIEAEMSGPRCSMCDEPLGSDNATGLCWRHVGGSNWNNPDMRERQAAGIQRRYALDPEYLDKLRARARALAGDKSLTERRTKQLKGGAFAGPGMAAMRSPEARAKAGRAISANRLSWCPAELRAAYRHLIRSKRMKAADAREMILAQHERDMAVFRRRLEAASA